MNKEVCLVINTPKAKRNYAEDRKTIRKVCLKYKVSYIKTLAGAVAAVKGIEAVKNGNGGEGGVKSLQEYHVMIKQVRVLALPKLGREGTKCPNGEKET